MINVFLLYDKFNIVNPFCVSVCLADSNTKFFLGFSYSTYILFDKIEWGWATGTGYFNFLPTSRSKLMY